MLLKLLQQQQQQHSTQPLWGGLAKQAPSMKALLELQQESERHLQKQAQPRAQQRAVSGPSFPAPLWLGQQAFRTLVSWGGRSPRSSSLGSDPPL